MIANQLWEEAEAALVAGDRGRALDTVDEALHQPLDEEGLHAALDWLETIAHGASQTEKADALTLQAVAFNQLGAFADALTAADRALALVPAAVPARIEQAMALFELARFPAAAQVLEQLERDAPQEAWVHFALGLLAERRGDEPAAQRCFARAATLAPADFPLAVRIDEQEFDAVINDAIADLPEMASQHLDKVVICAEPFPSDDDLQDGDLSPTVLGFFRGVPVGARSISSSSDHAPASIVLFQRNLERAAKTRAELIEQIAITVAHEVGHLLGLDEDDLEERGLG
ncbi:MAG: metallopeptidase family protein [Myxococcaceae bacterium]|nr:metallopeptidase family protein [Myxococcaceae bacterium]